MSAPEVLLEIGVGLGLPGMTNEDGSAKFPGGYSDYIVNHERMPGVGSLMGWRGEDGSQEGKGAVNPKQLEKYIENGCYWRHELKPNELYFKHANKDYLELSAELGFNGNADR